MSKGEKTGRVSDKTTSKLFAPAMEYNGIHHQYTCYCRVTPTYWIYTNSDKNIGHIPIARNHTVKIDLAAQKKEIR